MVRKLLVTLQDIQGRRGGGGEERAGWGIRWGRADLASLAASHCYHRTREFRNPSSVFSQDFTDKGGVSVTGAVKILALPRLA